MAKMNGHELNDSVLELSDNGTVNDNVATHTEGSKEKPTKTRTLLWEFMRKARPRRYLFIMSTNL